MRVAKSVKRVADRPGRPKDLGKRAAILAAAKQLFLSRGFEGASMDAIAAEAGVSKLTVYSHFTDKDSLFVAAVEASCEEQLPQAYFAPATGARRGDIRQRLGAIAAGFHALISSPDAVAVHRMIAAQTRASAKLGELFYEAGPKRTLRDFDHFLKDAVAAGELRIADTMRASGHFFCMVKGVDHMRRLCGWNGRTSPAERKKHLDSVVDVFLAAYGRAR